MAKVALSHGAVVSTGSRIAAASFFRMAELKAREMWKKIDWKVEHIEQQFIDLTSWLQPLTMMNTTPKLEHNTSPNFGTDMNLHMLHTEGATDQKDWPKIDQTWKFRLNIQIRYIQIEYDWIQYPMCQWSIFDRKKTVPWFSDHQCSLRVQEHHRTLWWCNMHFQRASNPLLTMWNFVRPKKGTVFMCPQPFKKEKWPHHFQAFFWGGFKLKRLSQGTHNLSNLFLSLR